MGRSSFESAFERIEAEDSKIEILLYVLYMFK